MHAAYRVTVKERGRRKGFKPHSNRDWEISVTYREGIWYVDAVCVGYLEIHPDDEKILREVCNVVAEYLGRRISVRDLKAQLVRLIKDPLDD